MELKSVGEILNDKLVVPEIQRDYVWGANNSNPDIVRNFVLDLNEKAKNNEDFQLGFLYSYGHWGELHLIDGQQRMTTLVILAFFCACKEGVETKDIMDTVGHFSYRVRVDTENFMHGLFSHKDEFVKDLSLFSESKFKDNTWFRAKYNQDTTIVSMVKSLDTIYGLFRSLGIDFCLTFTWILKSLSFWTFEVAQTSQGEELYISMNSRGEPLTDSEMFKPRLFEKASEFKCLSAPSWGKAWDNWEELLFQNKTYVGHWNYPVESVSDAMNSFLRIVIEMETGKPERIDPSSDASKINLSILESYFKCLERICKEEKYRGEIRYLYENNLPLLVLKIMLAVLRAGEEEKEVERIYPIIKNWERRGQLKNEGLLKVLYGFQHQDGQHLGWLDYILSLIKEKEEPVKREIEGVLDNHEWLKIKRYQEFRDPELEEAYHSAECNNVMNGHIRAVWDEAFESDFNWDYEALKVFKARFEAFKALFDDRFIMTNLKDSPASGHVDNALIARAMLSIKPYGVWVSGKNYAYGWKGRKKNYWQLLASRREASVVMSKVVDRIVKLEERSEDNILSSLNGIIKESCEKYKPGSGLYYIINYRESLKAQVEGRNVISFDGDWDNFNIWILEKDNAHSYYYNMFLSILYYRNKGKEGIWKLETARILLHNGLCLKCSWKQGWDVVYDNWEGNLELLKQNIDRVAESCRTTWVDNGDTQKRHCYFIQRGDNDQIKLGQAILDEIRSLSKS